jgi:hypothetical protein
VEHAAGSRAFQPERPGFRPGTRTRCERAQLRDLPRFAPGTVAAQQPVVRVDQKGVVNVMKRMSAFALALATFLTAGVVNAAPSSLDEIQAPRDQEIQAPRDQDVQAPRG